MKLTSPYVMEVSDLGEPLPKGTIVRIRTTNGGLAVVKLAEQYRPSYSVAVETDYGHSFVMLAWRIRSIEAVNSYWSPPLTENEVADIRRRLAFWHKRSA